MHLVCFGTVSLFVCSILTVRSIVLHSFFVYVCLSAFFRCGTHVLSLFFSLLSPGVYRQSLVKAGGEGVEVLAARGRYVHGRLGSKGERK